MYFRFEATLIEHCAATLAGHKAGSLFSYRLSPGEEPMEYIENFNTQLEHKGVKACLLKFSSKRCLVYVFRPKALQARLSGDEESAFLGEYGYERGASLDNYLNHLSQRIQLDIDFPHEIGLFLDYPLADVIGFIENQGEHYCCAGCWKAYSDMDNALRRFAIFRKCRKVYMDCYRRGFALSRLTVAA